MSPSFTPYLGDIRPEFRIVGGASKISVCFSGNISVSHNSQTWVWCLHYLLFYWSVENFNYLQMFNIQHVGDIFMNLVCIHIGRKREKN